MRASIWVFETLMRNESKGVQWRAEVGTLFFWSKKKGRAPSTDRSRARRRVRARLLGPERW